MHPCDICRMLRPDYVPFPLPVDPTGDAHRLGEGPRITACVECAQRLHHLMTLVITAAQQARDPNAVIVGTHT